MTGTDTEFARHNHDQSGQPASPETAAALPFGRRKPAGECPRCDQLHAGAAPRQAPAALRAGLAAAAREQQDAADRAAHFAPGGPHQTRCLAVGSGVATCFDW